jgi:CRP/FNR family transcriptional regulator
MFLLSLSERFGRRGYSETEFILAMSRRDIASFLRLATETVSRVLARFQKSGLLKVDRKQVRIRDLDELKKMAHRPIN